MARAGRLREWLRIERVTETPDTNSGGILQVWELFDERPAMQLPTGGREFTAAAQTHAELTHLLTVRYDEDRRIHPKDQIIWDGADAPLQILAAPVVRAPNRHPMQELTCRELVDGG